MSFRQAEHFIFAGEYSTNYGITNVNVSTDLYSEPFISPRSISTVKVRGRAEPYFQDIQSEVLRINVRFYFDNTFTSDSLRNVARWLGDHDYYQPLIFSDDLNKIYYVLLNNESELIHNGLGNGYIDLEFISKSPYAFSPQYLSSEIKTSIQDIAEALTTDTSIKLTSHGMSTGQWIMNETRNNVLRQVTVVDANTLSVSAIIGMSQNDVIHKFTNNTVSNTFLNSGDITIKPEIEIFHIGTNDITITNTSNGNQSISFAGLQNEETIYVNCETGLILTDVANTYRYSAMSGDFLEMRYGNNFLNITGDAILRWRYYFKFS